MKHHPKHSRGIAMVLVVVLMAAAAIMAFALLSNASMQSQISGNQTASFSASGLSESGVNLALYYLMYPVKASSSDFTIGTYGSYYNPVTDIPSLHLDGAGSIDQINVTNPSQGNYTITVNASDGSGSARISRTTTAQVLATSRYVVQYAMASNDAFSIPMSVGSTSIVGNVRCDGGIGGATSDISSGATIIPLNTAKPVFPQNAVPTYSHLNLCKSMPSYQTGNSADVLTGNVSGSSPSMVTIKTNNPGNVWYYATNDLTMSGTVNFNGTLVLAANRNLIIAGNVTITPKTGYPALIVGNNIEFSGSGKKLTVNGVCWLGGNLTGTGLLPQGTLTVNGSLMWGGVGPKFDTTKLYSPASKLIVTWPTSAATIDPPTPDVVYCPNLTDIDQTPKNIKVVSLSSN